MGQESGFSLEELAQRTQTIAVGDLSHRIKGVAELERAGADEAAFLDNPRYASKLNLSSAGVVVMHSKSAPPPKRNVLLAESPTLAFQKLIELFKQPIPTGFEGIHSSATIHPEAILDPTVRVGPHAVIDRGARIGRGTRIDAGVFIGAAAVIGEECHLYPHSIVREGCILGNRVILQPAAVIGSCGFGYFTDASGVHHPLQQLGIVVIEDDVHIGSHTVIDRARFEETRIGEGTKIDNLVQIAHQVKLGKHNMIISQTGIAGSSQTGDNVIMAGQVGVIGHLRIASRVILAARSAVINPIEKEGVYSGAPAIPIREFNELSVHLRNLPKLVKRLQEFEKTAQKSWLRRLLKLFGF